MLPFDKDGERAVHEPVIAQLDYQLSRLIKVIQKVPVAFDTDVCGKRAPPVEFGADVSPTRGNQDIQSGVVQEPNGKTSSLGETFKYPAKFRHINEITDPVFLINEMRYVIHHA